MPWPFWRPVGRANEGAKDRAIVLRSRDIGGLMAVVLVSPLRPRCHYQEVHAPDHGSRIADIAKREQGWNLVGPVSSKLLPGTIPKQRSTPPSGSANWPIFWSAGKWPPPEITDGPEHRSPVCSALADRPGRSALGTWTTASESP